MYVYTYIHIYVYVYICIYVCTHSLPHCIVAPVRGRDVHAAGEPFERRLFECVAARAIGFHSCHILPFQPIL